jgi:hypothetical protein
MIEFIDNDDPRFLAFIWVSVRNCLAHGAEQGVTLQWRARAETALERYDAALERMPVEFQKAVRLEASERLLRRRAPWPLADAVATLHILDGMILPSQGWPRFLHDGSIAACNLEEWIVARCGVHADEDERLDDELRILAELLRDAGLSPGNVVSFGGSRR